MEESNDREYKELKEAFGVIVPEVGPTVGIMILASCLILSWPWLAFYGSMVRN